MCRSRYYHYGFDKPDNVDEIGQPIDEELQNSLNCDQNVNDYDEDCCIDKNFFDLEPLPVIPEPPIAEEEEEEVLKEPTPPPEEGTDADKPKDIFPQIVPTESLPELEECEEPMMPNLKRSDSALNIFDQTTILKLFSAKNWTETFFNRIFRKKFTVISPGEDALLAFKNGFDVEQRMMHISQSFPHAFLPAIASSERDKILTNGLCRLFSPALAILLHVWMRPSQLSLACNRNRSLRIL